MQLIIDDIADISDLTDYAKEAFTSGSTDRVGRAIHESLLNQLREGYQPEGEMFGVTNQRVMICSVNAETHEERAVLARNAGRAFAASSFEEDEALLFIGCSSVGVVHSDSAEYAFTYVQDLSALRAADSRESLADAVKNAEVRMFLDELRNNAVVATHNDGDLCVTKDEYDRLSKEAKVGKTTGQNNLLGETLIGSITSIPFVQNGGLNSDNN